MSSDRLLVPGQAKEACFDDEVQRCQARAVTSWTSSCKEGGKWMGSGSVRCEALAQVQDQDDAARLEQLLEPCSVDESGPRNRPRLGTYAILSPELATLGTPCLGRCSGHSSGWRHPSYGAYEARRSIRAVASQHKARGRGASRAYWSVFWGICWILWINLFI